MMLTKKRRRVRLHMRQGEPSIEGFLLSRVNGHFVIAKGELLEAQGRTHELAGEVWVPRSNVSFYQVLPE